VVITWPNAARRVASAAQREVLTAVGNERAVVVKAVAGAGKTGFVVETVGAARERGCRLVVCAPTNAQAFEHVDRIARRYPGQWVTFAPAQDVVLPPSTAALPNVRVAQPARTANGAAIIVGTFDKIGDAFARNHLAPVDLLLADESYQADAARYYAVAGMAPTHLLVGDPGQLSPFSTLDDDDRWRGLAEDPLQTAVGILLRNHHAATPVYQMPITRRLDTRAAPIARAFYPGHEFGAAVLPGVRQLQLLPGASRDRRTRLLDRSLDLAASDGWAHVELPDTAVLTADPETASFIVDLLHRLVERARGSGLRVLPFPVGRLHPGMRRRAGCRQHYGEGLRHGVDQLRTACRHSNGVACGEPVDRRLECNRYGDHQRSWDCDAKQRDKHTNSTGHAHDSGHRDVDAGTDRHVGADCDNGTDEMLPVRATQPPRPEVARAGYLWGKALSGAPRTDLYFSSTISMRVSPDPRISTACSCACKYSTSAGFN
jgi:hypothetical protein